MKYLLVLFLAVLLIPSGAYAYPLADGLKASLAAYNRKDYPAAIKLLQPLAEQGNAAAQLRMGLIYEVKQDYAEELKWMHMAADQGNGDAQRTLGRMYFKGEGVRKDDAASLKWYHMSAEQGDHVSQFSVGRMYANGQGVKKDNVRAYMWLILAAEGKDKSFAEERDKVGNNLTPEQIREARHLAGEWKPAQ